MSSYDSNIAEFATKSILFSSILIHFITAISLLSFCVKKKIDLPKSDASENSIDRPHGGNEATHFTPPHIDTAPGRSLLRQRQTCPVHCQFSWNSKESMTFIDSADTSKIEFDSTQQETSSVSFLKRCTCFCGQKRVRFQCPSTTYSDSISFGFL